MIIIIHHSAYGWTVPVISSPISSPTNQLPSLTRLAVRHSTSFYPILSGLKSRKYGLENRSCLWLFLLRAIVSLFFFFSYSWYANAQPWHWEPIEVWKFIITAPFSFSHPQTEQKICAASRLTCHSPDVLNLKSGYVLLQYYSKRGGVHSKSWHNCERNIISFPESISLRIPRY